MQRASYRRNFTPAQPDSPATSLRDFVSGAYTLQQRRHGARAGHQQGREPAAADRDGRAGLLWQPYQPGSAEVSWFRERVSGTGARMRKVMVVALARKLLIALWRFATQGVVPDGAVMKPAS